MNDIAVDPLDWRVAYLATGMFTGPMDRGPGLGVFRTTDGGETWKPIKQGMGDVPVYVLAIRPDRPQTIYAGTVLTSDGRGTVLKSTNSGNPWAATGLMLDWGSVTDLAIDPLAPNIVYAGTDEGLFRSTDGGATWTRAAGDLSSAGVLGLAVASADERTILYVGTLGSLGSGVQAYRDAGAVVVDGGFAQAGVYQLTTIHRPLTRKAHLSLVLRDS